ncbi:uncharacterized protein PHACADRAFT_206449 [Phanerochaete carnosa HHB-10118-sp]|uniref:DUF6533 domain-containing protein n=1 Tax=Phanerochaete carnosa (strain HHB-10118-sp) TaxID=650164 RepID=K5WE28_PHACS|nr:uncharacterized protein PHACADRAFT_206449 [Phanerochaete carnosa HHB-10118-sp]EKM57550.1 hypothetical protein PHACADRAFT_206449 [Phanerochaete carnosa HHB-10118-sp]
MSSGLATAVSQLMAYAIITLIIYDHLITLDQEVRTVWQQKFSIVSLLIVSTRSTPLATVVFAFIPEGLLAFFRGIDIALSDWDSAEDEIEYSCTAFGWIAVVPQLVAFTQTAGEHNASLPPGVLLDHFFRLWLPTLFLVYFPPPVDICTSTPDYSDEVNHIILLVLNVSQIVSFYFESVITVTAFASILPPILICRFMTDLRLVNRDESSTSEAGMSQQQPSLRIPTFNDGTTPSFAANMGEPLDYGQNDRWDRNDIHVSNEQPIVQGEPHA